MARSDSSIPRSPGSWKSFDASEASFDPELCDGDERQYDWDEEEENGMGRDHDESKRSMVDCSERDECCLDPDRYELSGEESSTDARPPVQKDEKDAVIRSHTTPTTKSSEESRYASHAHNFCIRSVTKPATANSYNPATSHFSSKCTVPGCKPPPRILNTIPHPTPPFGRRPFPPTSTRY